MTDFSPPPEADASLLEMSSQRKYALNRSYLDSKWYLWLEWSDYTEASAEIEDLFRRVFAPFEPFKHLLPLSEDEESPSIPMATFLSRWPGEFDHFRDLYEKAVRHFTNRRIPFKVQRGMLPALITERDGLQKQVEREAQCLAVVFDGAQSVLKVWLAEAYRKCMERSENGHPLLVNSRALWDRIKKGSDVDELNDCGLLSRFLFEYDLPEVFSASQRDGVLGYLRTRDKILRVAEKLDARRSVCEVILTHAILDKRLPNWESIRGAFDRDGREMHAQNKGWVRETFNSLREENPGYSNSKIYEVIQKRYELEFGEELREAWGASTDVEISETTIRRYIGKR